MSGAPLIVTIRTPQIQNLFKLYIFNDQSVAERAVVPSAPSPTPSATQEGSSVGYSTFGHEVPVKIVAHTVGDLRRSFLSIVNVHEQIAGAEGNTRRMERCRLIHHGVELRNDEDTLTDAHITENDQILAYLTPASSTNRSASARREGSDEGNIAAMQRSFVMGLQQLQAQFQTNQGDTARPEANTERQRLDESRPRGQLRVLNALTGIESFMTDVANEPRWRMFAAVLLAFVLPLPSALLLMIPSRHLKAASGFGVAGQYVVSRPREGCGGLPVSDPSVFASFVRSVHRIRSSSHVLSARRDIEMSSTSPAPLSQRETTQTQTTREQSTPNNTPHPFFTSGTVESTQGGREDTDALTTARERATSSGIITFKAGIFLGLILNVIINIMRSTPDNSIFDS